MKNLTIENLEKDIKRYKIAGYTPEKTFEYLSRYISKGEIVQILGFYDQFCVDYAIPKILWSDLGDNLQNYISLYPNQRATHKIYRRDFRVFNVVKFYKRQLKQIIKKVYTNTFINQLFLDG